MKKILPANSELTTYFCFKNQRVFGFTRLDSDQILLKIVHCWDDGEIMNYGYAEDDGIIKFPTEQSPNPRHIVRIYKKQPSRSTIYRDINKFLLEYYPHCGQTPSTTKGAEK